MKNGKPWRVRKAEAAKQSATPKPTTRKVPEGHNPHAPRGIVPWTLPTKWQGRTFHIVGGGPSLKDRVNVVEMQMVRTLKPDDVWIVVNNSYKICKWADILHFADCEWWRWNEDDVLKNWPEDRIITTATSDVVHVKHPRIMRWWRDRNKFTEDKRMLHGWDGGTQAVNMAFHLGAAKIVLWGIDMQPASDGSTQWHAEHKRPTRIANYKDKFAPSLAESVRFLAKRGIPVVRATEPGIPEAPYQPQVAQAIAEG